MMLTDDELRALISNRYDGSALRVELEQIEQRGRRRRRNGRIATGSALAAVALAIGGTAAFAVHRTEVNNQVAAFDRACQASYTQEAEKTLRAEQLPSRLDRPIIELQSGGAAFRLYAAESGPLRSMIFDCLRAVDGSVSGRISFGPKEKPTFGIPAVVYRDSLPDGSAALVAQLRDPVQAVTVAPETNVKVAVKEGYVVVWGPQADIDRTVFTFGQDGQFDVAQDYFSLTATYQEPEFEAYCRRALQESQESQDVLPSLVLTTQHGAGQVLKVYRGSASLSLCAWSIMPDDPANGLTFNGPMTTLGTSSRLSSEDYGTTMRIIPTDGSGAWISGITPLGTRHVEILAKDGTVVPADLGDGAYAAWLPGIGEFTTITMTTDTDVYIFDGKNVTRTPRN